MTPHSLQLTCFTLFLALNHSSFNKGDSMEVWPARLSSHWDSCDVKGQHPSVCSGSGNSGDSPEAVFNSILPFIISSFSAYYPLPIPTILLPFTLPFLYPYYPPSIPLILFLPHQPSFVPITLLPSPLASFHPNYTPSLPAILPPSPLLLVYF